MKDKYRTIKYCAYALLTIGCFVLENARGTSISFWGGSVSTMPFIVTAIALLEGPYAAAIFGFAAGILTSIHSPMIEGLDALYLGLFGIVFGYIGAAYMRQVLLSAMLGGTLCLLLQGVCRYVFYYGLLYGMPLAVGLKSIAAELLLSILPGVLIYFIIRRLHRRFREAEA